MATFFDDTRIELRYGHKALDLLPQIAEMKALIDHELCHVKTMPTMVLQVLDLPDAKFRTVLQDYVDLFREYLAEQEYVRRFPNRRVYLRTKKKILQPVVDFKRQEFSSLEDLKVAILRVFYDSICFHMVSDSTFLDWCQERGQDDVSQRSFGMQLTAMGLDRRRRGRGKHWWEGIRLSGSTEKVESGNLELVNGHRKGYQPELAP